MAGAAALLAGCSRVRTEPVGELRPTLFAKSAGKRGGPKPWSSAVNCKRNLSTSFRCIKNNSARDCQRVSWRQVARLRWDRQWIGSPPCSVHRAASLSCPLSGAGEPHLSP